MKSSFYWNIQQQVKYLKNFDKRFFAGFPSLRSATKDQNTLAGPLHWNKAKMQVSVTNYKDDINSLSQN